MLSVQRRVEAIAAHQVLKAIAWLDECQVHSAIVELLIQSLEHFSGSDVDVSDPLGQQNDPGRGRSRANLRTLSQN